MASRKRVPRAKLPKRNLAAKQATNQKAVVMKDRREQRGGARNTMRQDLSESE
jgi:hypothetical protein